MSKRFVLIDIRDEIHSAAPLQLSSRDEIIFFRQLFDYCIDYDEYIEADKKQVLNMYIRKEEYYDLEINDYVIDLFTDISISIYSKLRSLTKKLKYKSVLDIPYRFRNLNRYSDAILEKKFN